MDVNVEDGLFRYHIADYQVLLDNNISLKRYTMSSLCLEGVVRSRKLKDRKYNGLKKTDKKRNNISQNTAQKPKS